MKSIRIGMGAGYAGDRLEPAIELLEQGNLDYLCFECMAERTTAIAMLQKKYDPQKGYNELLEYRFDKILDSFKSGRRAKIVTNMGAANPLSACEVIRDIAVQKGLSNLKIAAVTGDEVLDRIGKYMDYETMETGRPLSDYKNSIISANAYIGIEGIVKALQNGADIIITGRTADPSLVLGPAVYEFGWSLDDADILGAGTIAGHLLECAGQIVGGYFADPGYKEVPELWRLGFPIGTVYENGNVKISKVESAGGMVTEATVKEQLLYEIQNPAAYLTPDCIADITQAEVHEVAKNEVMVTGIKGHPKTGKLKVNVGYKDCYIGEGEISYGGHSALQRARMAADIVQKRLDYIGVEYTEIRFDLIGVTSLYKEEIGMAMTSGHNSEVRMRVAARTNDKINAEKIGNEVETLLNDGPASGGGARKYVREILSLASILVDESEVDVHVTYFEVA